MAAQSLTPERDREYTQNFPVIIFGLDEVGRGCVAGPVVASCVAYVLGSPVDSETEPVRAQGLQKIPRIDDSKKLSELQRDKAAAWIKAQSWVVFETAEVSAAEIDQINILQASLKAMSLAFQGVLKKISQGGIESFAKVILIDGTQIPKDLKSNCPDARVYPLVKGDSRSFAIAAAAILAKTHRDALMGELAKQHPHYSWESNVGYLSAAHLNGIRTYGLSPWHRKSFRINL